MRFLIAALFLISGCSLYYYFGKSQTSEVALEKTLQETVQNVPAQGQGGPSLIKDVGAVVNSQAAQNAPTETTRAPSAEELSPEAKAWNDEAEQLDKQGTTDIPGVFARVQDEIRKAKTADEVTKRLFYLTRFGNNRADIGAVAYDILTNSPIKATPEEELSLRQSAFSIFISHQDGAESALKGTLEALDSERDDANKVYMANQFLNRYPDQAENAKPLFEQKVGKPL